MTEIQKRLFDLKDDDLRTFNIKLNPTVAPDTVIGVRLPVIRTLAKELNGSENAGMFLSVLPHEYYEEYHLHSFLLAKIKDFDQAAKEVNRLLPYIDNWGVCDSLRVKAFEKSPERLLPYIDEWIQSEHTYTVRYAILCLMNYFLDDRFEKRYLQTVSSVTSDEYYIRMMISWYFATALSKQYDDAVKILEENKLERWVHNKTIQKAVESYRIPDERKAYLRSLRRK